MGTFLVGTLRLDYCSPIFSHGKTITCNMINMEVIQLDSIANRTPQPAEFLPSRLSETKQTCLPPTIQQKKTCSTAPSFTILFDLIRKDGLKQPMNMYILHWMVISTKVQQMGTVKKIRLGNQTFKTFPLQHVRSLYLEEGGGGAFL